MSRRLLFLATLALAARAIAAPLPVPASNTLAAVKARGELVCGVIGSSPGFSLPDSTGRMQGMDADACRAVAAAALGDAGKVKFVSLAPAQRLTALQSGEVDVVGGNLSWTLGREARSGIEFASVHYFDGAGFLVPAKLRLASASQLNGASICMLAGASEGASQDYLGPRRIRFRPVVFSEGEELRRAFLSGRCDVYMTDVSALANFRASLGAEAANYAILPDIVSKEPLGLAVRKGDGKWFDLVRWSHFAMVSAEELGVTRDNVDRMRASPNPEVRRLLGVEGDYGSALGVDNRWAYDILRAVGNYGEMWARNIGPSGAPRGPNRLWNDGGLQYAPPIR